MENQDRDPAIPGQTIRRQACSRRQFAKLAVAAVGALAMGEAPALSGDEPYPPHIQDALLPAVRYGVGPCWPRELGDVRALVASPKASGAVRVRIPWRRRDANPKGKEIIIHDARTGKMVENVAAIEVNRVFGDIVFQLSSAPGTYEVYYMPFTVTPTPWAYSVRYDPAEPSASAAWLEHYELTPGLLPGGKWKALPQASVREIQARSEFDRFDPMEVIATRQETAELLAKTPHQPYLLFPEERQFPIRMTEDLPQRWIARGPSAHFRGEARPGEFYVFQAGLYACQKGIENLTVVCGDLRSSQGRVIEGAAIRCFNLAGTGWDGQPIRKSFAVSQGKVGALWFGVQVPEDAVPGKYRGALTLRPKGGKETSLRISLAVSNPPLEIAGDHDVWRLSRLRWLDSTLAIDGEITAPYTPLQLRGRQITCLDRQVRLGNTGLPSRIRSSGREILAKPIDFVLETSERKAEWQPGKTRILKEYAGVVTWASSSAGSEFELLSEGTMEFDGYLDFSLRLRALKRSRVTDLRLEIPIAQDVAVYMMGLGRKGGHRPEEWEWKWDVNRADNMLWLGDYNAGLRLHLKNTQETWDLFDLKASGIPESWGNEGKGGCRVTAENDVALVSAYSGARDFSPGQELLFHFGLLITPVKPLDPAHWTEHYFQQGYPEPGAVPIETLLKSGVTIVNIHQGNELNPYINYPFLTVDKLSSYVDQVHTAGLKAKIYYTVRELSNRALELWALRSLGYEILEDGPGGGGAWLREHLVSHYQPAWHTALPWGEVDEAIADPGLTRWDNYYLEGLAYLLRNAEIDGLYLDGIGYNRDIMKRVRKVLDRTRPGCLIDFHSGNSFTFHDYRISPANQYMAHFPYINSLWFGEGYNYNESPDYWLVEISGIPFGLFGDMLQGGGNPWRGMVYGMTARCYQNANPTPIWRFWDEFRIREAEMIGYWVPSCPVKTGRKDVLATVYKKKGSALISLASWSKDPVSIFLNIDWGALGQDAETSKLTAPPILNFQEAASFSPAEKIPVQPGRGWLLILDDAGS